VRVRIRTISQEQGIRNKEKEPKFFLRANRDLQPLDINLQYLLLLSSLHKKLKIRVHFHIHKAYLTQLKAREREEGLKEAKAKSK